MLYSRIITTDENLNEIIKKLKLEKKADFAFYDLIYLNKNGSSITDDTLKVRVYQKNEWNNKNVLVIKKEAPIIDGAKEDIVTLREEFDTEDEAINFVNENFSNQYEYKLKLEKDGIEYGNSDLRVWFENIKDIGFSVEFGSNNIKNIEYAISLFDVKERLNKSVPEYLYDKIFNKTTLKNYFIIHGFMGSNIENWFPWLKEQIDSNSSLCTIPQFPIELDKHNYGEWKKLLDIYYKEFNMINEESIIIGHSTGSICALKYVLENKVKIDKLILISGFNNYFSPFENDIHNKINPTYYVEEEKIKDIKKYTNEIICIYGDNDPYIPQNTLHEFANSIDAKEVIVKDGGHLNKESGYIEFIDILKYI